MAKLEEAKSKRTLDLGAQEAAFGAAALTTLDPLFQASNRLLEGWMAVSSEILEFGKTRFDRGLEMSKALAQSSSFNEALNLQATYTRSIVQDYVSEAQKIADLGARSVLDSFTTLQQQAREKQTRETNLHATAAE
ncbi:MAG TPA: phasin family protein [Stellaceae bacterium]|jgi:hypothetical protein|nr:phasin family protein [Stellaceae bacterium]